MKYLILALLLAGCAEQQVEMPTVEVVETPKTVIETQYKVGQCLYLVDPENGFKGNKKDAMRVEEITSTHYVYRWWIYLGKPGWAIDTNRRTHANLERLTKPLEECPNEKR